jgi:aspartate racemase
MNKIAGLIGGIGCASTALYYKTITQHISQRLGPHHTGYILIYSIDEFDTVDPFEKRLWDKVLQKMLEAAKTLQNEKVDFILICSNTCHKFFDAIQKNCQVPILHILLPICDVINKQKYEKIGVLGTRITLTENFYSDYLLKNSTAKEMLALEKNQIDQLDRIIFDEIVNNIFLDESRKILIDIANSLILRGAQCIILGCTELCLILSQDDFKVPILDSTHLHAVYAAEYMLSTV